ncbi:MULTISPECIES: ABC transporter ATP-binding protein [Nocardiaceae]|jgi:ABC-2 type transport system ATP-binding protein|uniref:ABC transporter ATP-binding protein n=1 Tax=Nocardiaceae TaxID=85025 RepID=UPI0005645EBB|nr:MULTISPECIES: ABC transporter ATP-binding protein [Rhodococcus]OZE94737.1 ABC transporter ATP-binding protein [Rhodococcus sp. 15-1189-1-1a]OZF09048.1 ABC transporter ATP-binding protein [Rhodococcus sp. 14-2686-1-2]
MNARHDLTVVDDSPVIASVRNLTKTYGDFTAVDGVDFDLHADKIYGLLGRNGAGKTTVMQLLTAQNRQSAGTVEVFGMPPFENSAVSADVCFVKESQKYPDDFRVRHVLTCAARLLPHWDRTFADELVRDFDLPPSRKVKKLSRGMTSALGIVIGLASRAPLTFFDEPYLGLDAVARHMFYDRLLADYAENPRTIVLSTHLIDEVSDLIEHVLLIDKGRIVIDADADDLRHSAFVISGAADAVEKLVADHTVLHRESLGSMARVSIDAALTDAQRAHASSLGLATEPLSLQQLVIRNTTAYGRGASLTPDHATEESVS